MIEYRVSQSCQMANCVAVGRSPDGAILMCDTKDCAQRALSFTMEEWTMFVAGVKAGEFDLA